jgi:hypothetical protein
MSTKPTDTKPSTPSLPFPTPLGFGEPIAALIVGMNAQGQCHFHMLGNKEPLLFLGSQALTYALTAEIVGKVQQGAAQLDLQASGASHLRGNS